MSSVVFPLKVSNNQKNNQNNKLIIQSVSNRQIFNKIQAESNKIQAETNKLQNLLNQSRINMDKHFKSLASQQGNTGTEILNPILNGEDTYESNPLLIDGSVYYFNIVPLFNYLKGEDSLHHYTIQLVTNLAYVPVMNNTITDITEDRNDVNHVFEFTADYKYTQYDIQFNCTGYDINNNVIQFKWVYPSMDYTVQNPAA